MRENNPASIRKDNRLCGCGTLCVFLEKEPARAKTNDSHQLTSPARFWTVVPDAVREATPILR